MRCSRQHVLQKTYRHVAHLLGARCPTFLDANTFLFHCFAWAIKWGWLKSIDPFGSIWGLRIWMDLIHIQFYPMTVKLVASMGSVASWRLWLQASAKATWSHGGPSEISWAHMGSMEMAKNVISPLFAIQSMVWVASTRLGLGKSIASTTCVSFSQQSQFNKPLSITKIPRKIRIIPRLGRMEKLQKNPKNI